MKNVDPWKDPETQASLFSLAGLSDYGETLRREFHDFQLGRIVRGEPDHLSAEAHEAIEKLYQAADALAVVAKRDLAALEARQ
jgi:hypothetical protein